MRKCYVLKIERKPSKKIIYLLKEHPEYLNYIKYYYYGAWITYHSSYKKARQFAKIFTNGNDSDAVYTHFKIRKVIGLDYTHCKFRKDYIPKIRRLTQLNCRKETI